VNFPETFDKLNILATPTNQHVRSTEETPRAKALGHRQYFTRKDQRQPVPGLCPWVHFLQVPLGEDGEVRRQDLNPR